MGLSQYLGEDGQIYEMEDDMFGIVQEIRDRFPSLRIKYLDPERTAGLTDAPYIITDQQDNVIITAWKLDRTVVDRLVFSQSYAAVEKALDDARRAVEKAKKDNWRDKIGGPAKDLALHVFKSPKTTYTFKNQEGKIVKVSDHPS